MRLKQLVRLVHPGVTRVFLAGRSAGNIRLGIRVVAESALALLIALRVSGVQPRRQNAMRHFIWQARLTVIGSAAFAERVGDLQEQGSPNPADSRVDQLNNEVGREYAVAHAARLARLGSVACFRDLTRAALEHWRDGRLWTDDGGSPAPSV